MNFFSLIRTAPIFGTMYALLSLYEIILIIRIILSWIQLDPYNPLVQFLYSVTEPVLNWARENIPIRFGMFDLSPIIVFAGLWVLKRLVLFFLITFRF